ncbi:hypothetical protein EMCRGX_G003643 [Ephydatia muelleri]
MEKRAEDEKDVYDITLNYIALGSYPQDATKQDKWLYGKLYEAIKDADSGHLGYRIGGDCSSIIA